MLNTGTSSIKNHYIDLKLGDSTYTIGPKGATQKGDIATDIYNGSIVKFNKQSSFITLSQFTNSNSFPINCKIVLVIADSKNWE